MEYQKIDKEVEELLERLERRLSAEDIKKHKNRDCVNLESNNG